jgi:hypothetical protein
LKSEGSEVQVALSVELKYARTREEQASIDDDTKISKDVKEMTVMDTDGSGHELTQNVNAIRNVRASAAKIEKTTNKMAIVSEIL